MKKNVINNYKHKKIKYYLYNNYSFLMEGINNDENNRKLNNSYDFSGIHYIANYIECKEGTLTDLTMLKKIMTEAVIKSGATILNMTDHVFESDENMDKPGYTSMYLLSESHATIHTYPEVRSCFIDIFTCGTKCSYNEFDRYICSYLEPKEINFKVIKRDNGLRVFMTNS